MEDKVKFNKVYNNFLNREWLSLENASKEQVCDFLEKHKTVIVKPISGIGGRGIFLIENNEFAYSKLRNLKSQKYVLEEILYNSEYISKFNSSSLNTLRVYTAMNEHQEMTIMGIVFRVGSKGSFVDNFHGGGIAFNVNVNGGFIDAEGVCMNGNKFSTIDNNVLLGSVIVNVSELYDFMHKLVKVIPNTKWVGWDVAITDKGFAVIEGNAYWPGQDILQIKNGCFKQIKNIFA